MSDTDVLKERTALLYTTTRQAQLLMFLLAEIQAELARRLNNCDTDDAVDFALWDLDETLDEFKKAKRKQDDALKRMMAREKASKPKKGRVAGNVIKLRTKAKRKPKGPTK